MRDTRRSEEKRESPQNVEMTTRGLMFKDLLMLRSMKVIKFRECEDAIEVAQAVSTLSQNRHDNQVDDHVREEDETLAKKERVKEKSPVMKHHPNCPRSKSHRESKRKKHSKEGSSPPKTVIPPTQSPPKAQRKHRSSRRKRNEERSANHERGEQRRQKSLPVAPGPSVGGGKLRRNMTTVAGEEGTSRVRWLWRNNRLCKKKMLAKTKVERLSFAFYNIYINQIMLLV